MAVVALAARVRERHRQREAPGVERSQHRSLKHRGMLPVPAGRVGLDRESGVFGKFCTLVRWDLTRPGKNGHVQWANL